MINFNKNRKIERKITQEKPCPMEINAIHDEEKGRRKNTTKVKIEQKNSQKIMNGMKWNKKN